MPARRKVSAPAFNPLSVDAQFAGLHATLAAQDASRNARMDLQDIELKEIKAQTKLTNGRVTVLEGKWKIVAGWVAGAAAVATIAVQLVLHFWK